MGMSKKPELRTKAQRYADRHLRHGRPPKARDAKQGERVTVNMTGAEREALEADAAKAGMSLSAYLLECWRRGRK